MTLIRTSATAAVLGAMAQPRTLLAEGNAPCPAPFPQVKGLTQYVAEFIVATTYADIPKGVIELGKKDILDGFGLALSGNITKSRRCDLFTFHV